MTGDPVQHQVFFHEIAVFILPKGVSHRDIVSPKSACGDRPDVKISAKGK